MPPERGSAAASSATVRAPHSAMMPPSTQQAMIGPGACSCAATVAGTRKIPLPMATPTDTATVCSRLTERGMRSPHWSAIKSLREQLDPVTHRQRGAAADMREAADVGGGDEVRRAALQSRDLLPQQPSGELRLQDGIGSRRTAALVAVADRGEGKARLGQQASTVPVTFRACCKVHGAWKA